MSHVRYLSWYLLTSHRTALLLGRKCVVNLVFSVKTSIMYKQQDDDENNKAVFGEPSDIEMCKTLLQKNVHFWLEERRTFHVVGTDYDFTGVPSFRRLPCKYHPLPTFIRKRLHSCM